MKVRKINGFYVAQFYCYETRVPKETSFGNRALGEKLGQNHVSINHD